MYWLLYILDMRFVLFLCTTAAWQFAINEYVMLCYVILSFVHRTMKRNWPELAWISRLHDDTYNHAWLDLKKNQIWCSRVNWLLSVRFVRYYIVLNKIKRKKCTQRLWVAFISTIIYVTWYSVPVFHQKGRHHTHGDICVKSWPIVKIFLLANFLVNLQ